MTRLQLWDKYRGLAIGISKSYYAIPGMGHDDMEQEALLALWIATEVYDPTVGEFPCLAAVIIRRRLIELLRRGVRRRFDWLPLLDEWDARAPESEIESLDFIAAIRALTPHQMRSVRSFLDGSYDPRDRGLENGLYKARKKLAPLLVA